jgi:hypothetical protein
MSQRPRVSEVAYVIAAIAREFPQATRQQLASMLAHTIAMPENAQLRAQRLGLACELVSMHGPVSVERYEQLRAERDDADWPAASTLIEHFGSWAKVLELALRLETQGHRPPVRSTHRTLSEPRGAYSRQEVIAGLVYAAHVVGYVPGIYEYNEIRRVLRHHARLTGTVIPRLAGQAPIRRLFGSYQGAAAVAAREPNHAENTSTRAGSHTALGTGGSSRRATLRTRRRLA